MIPSKTWRDRQEWKRRRELAASIILGAVVLCMVVAGVAGGIVAINHAHAERKLGAVHADHR